MVFNLLCQVNSEKHWLTSHNNRSIILSSIFLMPKIGHTVIIVVYVCLLKSATDDVHLVLDSSACCLAIQFSVDQLFHICPFLHIRFCTLDTEHALSLSIDASNCNS